MTERTNWRRYSSNELAVDSGRNGAAPPRLRISSQMVDERAGLQSDHQALHAVVRNTLGSRIEHDGGHDGRAAAPAGGDGGQRGHRPLVRTLDLQQGQLLGTGAAAAQQDAVCVTGSTRFTGTAALALPARREAGRGRVERATRTEGVGEWSQREVAVGRAPAAADYAAERPESGGRATRWDGSG